MSAPSSSDPRPPVEPPSAAEGAGASIDEAGQGQGGTVMDAIFASLFQPGLNTTTQRIMNFSFYGLFVSLLALLFLSSGNPHVIALLVLSVGLYAGVNWFLHELENLPPSALKIQEMPQDSKEAKAEGTTATISSREKKDL
ncbi:uncharacterized protein PFL1_02157 [Pseudozyma flocculosa PF-1]|uniref:Related to PKR1 - V-ATPase Assembly Factor n=1 Tax=Pseudozyma flocculosa TaxID=84751 RepID=A0A5C3FA87_9BASI|nr:uncharacterized protein PFL1_02157 [Pseudozyma flocculosa PF-1]EPQ30040.1 hypothetical protein PFL1_02157 [Pseudozyma flocculosa PF-1]SPO41373.1 related to PKR1 - V-ATPase Assembly Factor [Pseudozyma flocculosa]